MGCQVGADLWDYYRIRHVPEERLAERLGCFGVVGEAREVFAAFLPRCGVVGQNAPQSNAVFDVGGVFVEQPTQAGYSMGAAIFGGRFGLVVGQRPVARGGSSPKRPTIEDHCGGVLPCLGELGGLLELRLLVLLAAGSDALNEGDAGVVRIDCAQTIEVAVCECRAVVELGGAGKAGKRLSVPGVGQEHLLPGLLGEVQPAAQLERVRLVQQRLGDRWRNPRRRLWSLSCESGRGGCQHDTTKQNRRSPEPGYRCFAHHCYLRAGQHQQGIKFDTAAIAEDYRFSLPLYRGFAHPDATT